MDEDLPTRETWDKAQELLDRARVLLSDQDVIYSSLPDHWKESCDAWLRETADLIGNN